MRPGSEHELELDADGIPVAFTGWGAVGFICGVGADESIATRARGFHAKDMLFVVEETPGVHDAILKAIKVTCTAPHNLRMFFGNPDSQLDSLAKVSAEPGVVAVRASALDHPNVVLDNPDLIPGAASRQRIDEWRAEWGAEDPLFQSRAQGLAPAQSQSSLIRAEWVAAAWSRSAEWLAAAQGGLPAMGVDVAASDHGDKAAIAYGVGRVCRSVTSYHCPDPNLFAREEVFPACQTQQVSPHMVGVDSVGVGVGSINELKRLGMVVVGLNGGAAYRPDLVKDGEIFPNLRCQMWWQARLDLFHNRVAVPHDEELQQDLITPRWFTRGGKIVVESKEELRRRLGRSPDKADAFVYWNWMRQGFAGMAFTSVRVRWA
jgi:hypothetical protein